MAYVQFSLLHIPAVIIHGNTLSREKFGRWYTPAHIMDGWTRKLLREAEGEHEIQDVPEIPMPERPPDDNGNRGPTIRNWEKRPRAACCVPHSHSFEASLTGVATHPSNPFGRELARHAIPFVCDLCDGVGDSLDWNAGLCWRDRPADGEPRFK